MNKMNLYFKKSLIGGCEYFKSACDTYTVAYFESKKVYGCYYKGKLFTTVKTSSEGLEQCEKHKGELV